MINGRHKAGNKTWTEIFREYRIDKHNFDESPFHISAEQIKKVATDQETTTGSEVRILCYQITREHRPTVFQKRGLFILPTANGQFVIVKGEGYVDIPSIETPSIEYHSKIDYKLDTVNIGNSEMQHLDDAYAVSMVRNFMKDDPMKDDSLVLTIRGRKYTPEFSFKVGKFEITANKVQTEVDGGYEGPDRVVLVEAKNAKTDNTIIRQLYYPYRQWSQHTGKDVSVVFFEKRGKNTYSFWEFVFEDPNDYNSIRLARSAKYAVKS